MARRLSLRTCVILFTRKFPNRLRQLTDDLHLTDMVVKWLKLLLITEQGQHQLQQIFSEADQSGEARGELLKDRNMSDIIQDQKNNSMLNYFSYSKDYHDLYISRGMSNRG